MLSNSVLEKCSKNISNIGLVHGSIFLLIFPGKKPSSSSTETTGLVKIILFNVPNFSKSIAFKQANIVFPVPAGPIETTISTSSSFKKFTYLF